jgi:hypothetical protein
VCFIGPSTSSFSIHFGMRKTAFLRIVFVLGLWLAAGSTAKTWAQPGSGGPGPGTPDPTAVPLDGGVSLLVAAGIGLGLKRLRQRRKA